MKRNVHVHAACDRLLAQIREQLNSLNERRYIWERVSRLRLDEADDVRIAADLNRIADVVESSGVVATARNTLDLAKDLERGFKEVSARSAGKN